MFIGPSSLSPPHSSYQSILISISHPLPHPLSHHPPRHQGGPAARPRLGGIQVRVMTIRGMTIKIYIFLATGSQRPSLPPTLPWMMTPQAEGRMKKWRMRRVTASQTSLWTSRRMPGMRSGTWATLPVSLTNC
jgi:hypothetical protein